MQHHDIVSVQVKLIGWDIQPAAGGQATAHVVTASGDVMEIVPFDLLQSTSRNDRARTGVTFEASILDGYDANAVLRQLHASSVHRNVHCEPHGIPSGDTPVLQLNFLLNKRMKIRGPQYNGKWCKVVEVYPGGCSVMVDGLASSCPDVNLNYLRIVHGDGNESLPSNCAGVTLDDRIVPNFTGPALRSIGSSDDSERVQGSETGRNPSGTTTL